LEELQLKKVFRTLDKIAAVQIGTNDRPIDPEQVRIIKTLVVTEIDVPKLIEYVEPERTGSTVTSTPEFTIFENQELDVKFTVPVGWLLQQPQNLVLMLLML
jgi:hypothetical protein